jgi:hypothetical protein
MAGGMARQILNANTVGLVRTKGRRFHGAGTTRARIGRWFKETWKNGVDFC